MNTSSSVIMRWATLPLLAILSLAVACSSSDSSGSSSAVSGAYLEQIALYKVTYGKSDEWEDWMIEVSKEIGNE